MPHPCFQEPVPIDSRCSMHQHERAPCCANAAFPPACCSTTIPAVGQKLDMSLRGELMSQGPDTVQSEPLACAAEAQPAVCLAPSAPHSLPVRDIVSFMPSSLNDKNQPSGDRRAAQMPVRNKLRTPRLRWASTRKPEKEGASATNLVIGCVDERRGP